MDITNYDEPRVNMGEFENFDKVISKYGVVYVNWKYINKILQLNVNDNAWFIYKYANTKLNNEFVLDLNNFSDLNLTDDFLQENLNRFNWNDLIRKKIPSLNFMKRNNDIEVDWRLVQKKYNLPSKKEINNEKIGLINLFTSEIPKFDIMINEITIKDFL